MFRKKESVDLFTDLLCPLLTLLLCSQICLLQLSEQLLVEGWSLGFAKAHLELGTDALNALPGFVEGVLGLADALDAHGCFHLNAVTDGPLDDSEVDSVFLASVQALIEGLSVEKVAAKVDSEALQIGALALAVTLGCDCLVRLTQLLDVGVVRSQLAFGSDHSVADLHREVALLGEISTDVAADDSLDEGHELASKVI